MILIINVCKEKLHFYEFVKPVANVLINNSIKMFIRHYTCLTKKDLSKASKIIICGTSLKDNEFLENIDKFNWLKEIEKPVLGICAGFQIIGLVFGGELKKETEIGFYSESFKDFLGISGKQQVYHLHKNCVEFTNMFEVLSAGKVIQATKNKNIYGVLFHPEVRQKMLIENFANL